MKRLGIHKPTVEDAVEISDIETLHPGGFALTRRTAEIAGMGLGLKVLDVSSGRGTQSIFYAVEYGVEVTGVDISYDMLKKSTANAAAAGVTDKVKFIHGDSQKLPFDSNTFDIVVNECAVGIPDDSQQVMNEMVRVAKPGGIVVIHESTWRKKLAESEKAELSERYGTTPLEQREWIDMMKKAGLQNVEVELEQWSKPEMFWKVRKDRDVKSHKHVLTTAERLITIKRLIKGYGIKGVIKALENEKAVFGAALDGKLGYGLYKGNKKSKAD